MLQEVSDGIEIAIINPQYMVKDINNPEMRAVADEIYEKMQRVIETV